MLCWVNSLFNFFMKIVTETVFLREAWTNESKEWWRSLGHSFSTLSVSCFLCSVLRDVLSAILFLLWPKQKQKAILLPDLFYSSQLKLEGRDRVSVRETALEEKKNMNKHEITSDSERQWDASGGEKMRKNKRRGRGRRGGGIEERERELSQIESVCLGWY